MVSGDALAKWAALNAHKHGGMWVVLAADAEHPELPLETVDSRPELRLLRDLIRPDRVVVFIPGETVQLDLGEAYQAHLVRTMEDRAELEGYRLRNGKLATVPTPLPSEEGTPPSATELEASAEAFELGHSEGYQKGLAEVVTEGAAAFERGLEEGRRRFAVALEAADPTHPLLSSVEQRRNGRGETVKEEFFRRTGALPTDEQGPPINGYDNAEQFVIRAEGEAVVTNTALDRAPATIPPELPAHMDHEPELAEPEGRHAGHDGKKEPKKRSKKVT